MNPLALYEVATFAPDDTPGKTWKVRGRLHAAETIIAHYALTTPLDATFETLIGSTPEFTALNGLGTYEGHIVTIKLLPEDG